MEGSAIKLIDYEFIRVPQNGQIDRLVRQYIHQHLAYAYVIDQSDEGNKRVRDYELNRPGNRGGWLVLIMRLLSIPADYARIVPQTLRVGCDLWVQGDVLG